MTNFSSLTLHAPLLKATESLGYATISIDPHPGGNDRIWTMVNRLIDP